MKRKCRWPREWRHTIWEYRDPLTLKELANPDYDEGNPSCQAIIKAVAIDHYDGPGRPSTAWNRLESQRWWHALALSSVPVTPVAMAGVHDWAASLDVTLFITLILLLVWVPSKTPIRRDASRPEEGAALVLDCVILTRTSSTPRESQEVGATTKT